LFYGAGWFAAEKNTLALRCRRFAMMGLISVLWALVFWGIRLASEVNGKFIGRFSTCVTCAVVGLDPK